MYSAVSMLLIGKLNNFRLYGHKKYGGFFIEAGAYNGYSISNSLYFELRYNWTGLLVEPNPNEFAKMAKLNRKAWTFPNCFSTKVTHERLAITQSAESVKLVTGASGDRGIRRC